MKNFFKSDWFRCTAVLLCLLVFFGGLLAVLNDLLFVPPEERTARAIKKIYGSVPEYAIELDLDNGGTAITNDFGTISKKYLVGDDVLFRATGINGYKGGTITLWLKVVKTNENYVIDKVILDGYEKQTLMSKFGGDYYENFLIDVTDAYENGQGVFSPKADATGLKNPMSGATMSATAACNAVNCVITYLGGK
ncbi:MAG: hypothetical protein J6U92_02490 [Clostridia bacterium]|nr:hypothetical protein [Clostridia bacterium]